MLARGLEDAGFEPDAQHPRQRQQFFWFHSDHAVRIVEASPVEVPVASDPAGRDRILLAFATKLGWPP